MRLRTLIKKEEEFNKNRQEIRNKIQAIDAQFFNAEPFNELDFQEEAYVVLTDEQQEKDKVKVKSRETKIS